MDRTFKMQIGVFDGLEKRHRRFTPVFEQTRISETAMKAKLIKFCPGWHPRQFDDWLHKPDRERTFLMSGIGGRYGYRVIEETEKEFNN